MSKLAKAFEDGTLKKDMKVVMCCDLPENVQGTIWYQTLKILKIFGNQKSKKSLFQILKRLPTCQYQAKK